MVHHYQPISFPTWHNNAEGGINTHITANTYAAQVGFMINRNDPNTGVGLPYPEEGERAHFAPGLYLRREDAPEYDPANDPDTYNEFITQYDVTPDVVYFNPWDSIPQLMMTNVLNGLLIETSRISSFAVPTINPMRKLVDLDSNHQKCPHSKSRLALIILRIQFPHYYGNFRSC